MTFLKKKKKKKKVFHLYGFFYPDNLWNNISNPQIKIELSETTKPFSGIGNFCWVGLERYNGQI